MKFHPYSEVFPLLEGAAFEELVADIKAFGLREKIWQYDGKILDGRNRFLACQKAKVEPEYRTFKGAEKGALAFVVSANMHRRHLNESQRASAAAKIIAIGHGGDRRSDQAANLPLETQATAAEKFNVSERSVRAAKKVHERGSKALNKALDAGEVAVSRAAASLNLPKQKQLAAAKAPPKAPEPTEEPQAPSPDEIADIDAEAEQQYATSIAKVMEADDKLAAANKEIKRQAAEIATLKQSRDGFMNGKDEMTKLLKAEQRKTEKLARQLAQADTELEKLRERIAVMEAA